MAFGVMSAAHHGILFILAAPLSCEYHVLRKRLSQGQRLRVDRVISWRNTIAIAIRRATSSSDTCGRILCRKSFGVSMKEWIANPTNFDE